MSHYTHRFQILTVTKLFCLLLFITDGWLSRARDGSILLNPSNHKGSGYLYLRWSLEYVISRI